MYRYKIILILITALVASVLFAQANDASYTNYDSERYSIRTQGSLSDARAIATQLEAMHDFFNDYFTFPNRQDDVPLRVLTFSSKAAFNQYLQSLVQVQADGFIYLHYNRPGKNELVGFISDDNSVTSSLVRQAFLQYFRSHIANPPLWLSEGFGTYIRDARFDPRKQRVIFTENIVRAESLQVALQQVGGRSIFPIKSLFKITREDIQQNNSDFYNMAWGLLSYLLNTNVPQHTRILWNSIARLSPDASLSENQTTLQKYVYDWISYTELENAVISYTQSYETSRTLLGEGQALLQEKKYKEAEKIFTRVIELKPEGSTGYYYRGLANYHQENYELSIAFYEESVSYGLDENLGYFVIALSQYALGQTTAGIRLLSRIPTTSQYYSNAQDLLTQWTSN